MTEQLNFTKGSIPRQMIMFSIPIFLTNILQTSFQFIDSIWVGNLLGSDSLGAISVSATLIFTVLSFTIGVNSASLTVLSQKKGSKDDEGLKESLNAFVYVLGIMAAALGLIGYFSSEWLLKMLGTPNEILPLAKSYLQVNFLGILFLFGYNFIGTILRALGDSKTPIRFVLIAVLLNLFLDPIFISFFDMGIAGAAYATVASQGFAFVYGLWYSIKKANVPFVMPYPPTKVYMIALFKLGLPAGLQMMAISGGVAAIMGIVAQFGANAVAGFGAAQRIDSIIMLPAFTLGSAVNSMAGQNIGTRSWQRVDTISKYGLYIILVVSFSISIIAFISAEHLLRLFADDPETINVGATYLKSVAFFYPFLGINFVLNGIVRAAGAMVQVLILNLVSFWILRVPLTYLFSQWMGVEGIAYGVGTSFGISSFIAYMYYKYGRWRETEIFKQTKPTDT